MGTDSEIWSKARSTFSLRHDKVAPCLLAAPALDSLHCYKRYCSAFYSIDISACFHDKTRTINSRALFYKTKYL